VEPDPASWRHQVSKIPQPRVEITEYQRHLLTCTQCDKVAIGSLPEDASPSSFGPRLHAVTAPMSGSFFLSKRKVVTLYDVVYERLRAMCAPGRPLAQEALRD
jgi:transposase